MLHAFQEERTSRGTELLEELETVLPIVGRLTPEEELQCAVVTDLLASYWDVVRAGIDAEDPRYRHRLARNLRDTYEKCRTSHLSTACGIYIVACHIESAGLRDEDGRFVHGLTSLHVHRARSMLNAKTIDS